MILIKQWVQGPKKNTSENELQGSEARSYGGEYHFWQNVSVFVYGFGNPDERKSLKWIQVLFPIPHGNDSAHSTKFS
jgi:hypothetical protein